MCQGAGDMNQNDDQSSSEVAHEAEDARAGLAKTLGDLRDNLTPAHLAEEVVGNAQIGASALIDSAYELVREHPGPALLIGAGLAMVLGIGARRAGKPGGTSDGLRTTSPSLSSSGYTVGSTNNSPSHGSSLPDFLNEQPLIVAAIGIAVGAAVGAALPVVTF